MSSTVDCFYLPHIVLIKFHGPVLTTRDKPSECQHALVPGFKYGDGRRDVVGTPRCLPPAVRPDGYALLTTVRMLASPVGSPLPQFNKLEHFEDAVVWVCCMQYMLLSTVPIQCCRFATLSASLRRESKQKTKQKTILLEIGALD